MSAPGQQELWECPNCGRLYLAEDTGQTIRTRHYGTRKIVRFRTVDSDNERTKCTCGKHLHWLYNRVHPARLGKVVEA